MKPRVLRPVARSVASPLAALAAPARAVRLPSTRRARRARRHAGDSSCTHISARRHSSIPSGLHDQRAAARSFAGRSRVVLLSRRLPRGDRPLSRRIAHGDPRTTHERAEPRIGLERIERRITSQAHRDQQRRPCWARGVDSVNIPLAWDACDGPGLEWDSWWAAPLTTRHRPRGIDGAASRPTFRGTRGSRAREPTAPAHDFICASRAHPPRAEAIWNRSRKTATAFP